MADPSTVTRLQRLHPKSLYKSTVGTMSVPRPKGVRKADGSFEVAAFGGEPIRDVALLQWCMSVLGQVIGQPVHRELSPA